MRKIGIIGGGQLGRMTIEEARALLCYIEVLSPEYPAPGAELADETILGGLMDREAILELAARVDVVSYEIEHVNADALFEIEAMGKPVIPGAAVLALIQDKAEQKRLLDAAGIPTAPWAMVGDGLSPATATEVRAAAASIGGFPVVQKARRGGYDGRGVAVLRTAADALPVAQGGRLLALPSFVERAIDFSKELAVVVARDTFGAHAAYPCVEMVFDPRVNLCDSVLMPARESPALLAEAERLALAAVDALDAAAGADAAAREARTSGAAGIFGVELFLARDGALLVNEIAPRPHNSGHLSIEACATSQFLQYYRILAGYPLGSVEQLRPAMMVNLLGDPSADAAPAPASIAGAAAPTGTAAPAGVAAASAEASESAGIAAPAEASGGPGSAIPAYDICEPEYRGLEAALAVPGVSVHLYGKRELRAFRKMGHLCALGATVDEAMQRADLARSLIRILPKP
jgi:5-(carboxyamino)imidazole ribonucleotide synthase